MHHELLDLKDTAVKEIFRKYIHLRMRENHLRLEDLAECCDLKTVERWFRGPVANMPKALPIHRVYEFLQRVDSRYEDFVAYYQRTDALSKKTMSQLTSAQVHDVWINNTLWYYLSIGGVCILIIVFVGFYLLSSSEKSNISYFYAVTPIDHRDCENSKPFSYGKRRLKPLEYLSSGACFGLELGWNGKGTLLLLAESKGRLIRLFPNQCQALGGLLPKAGHLVFPLDDNGLATKYVLDKELGIETLFAFALDADQVNYEQAEILASLPDICTSQPDITTPSMMYLDQLNKLRWQQGKNWMKVEIWHM